MTAAVHGHIDTVRSLLDKPGIEIDAKNPKGATALDGACFNGRLKVVKLLVAAGARVNPQASNDWVPLVSAASGGQLQVVKYLVEEAGADVRWADRDGKTALMYAAWKGHVDVVDYLRGRQDINIDARSEKGHTALDLACDNGHLEVVKVLGAAGARVNPQAKNEWGPLVSAAFKGHLQLVKYLVEEAAADVRCTGPNGSTTLMLAAGGGHIDVVDYLRGRQDIDMDAISATGDSALGFACLNGHLEVVKLLVAAGARVNPQENSGWQPLVAAASGGQLQVVKYLVEEAGADVRWADPDGKTALNMAADEGHGDVADYLQEAISRREFEVSVGQLLQVHVYNRLM
jgi:ankyrin repeat protein